MQNITIHTTESTGLINITKKVDKIIKESDVKNGLCYLFVPHTTAAVTINESADPDVVSDMIMELNKVIPFKDNYRHMEGNSAAHIKASIIGSTEIIFIADGNLQLGTWQGIFFCEFDGPRTRQVWIKIVPDQ